MNKYLIFRTDRIGDFLFSLKLIKIIKLNQPNSEFTVISSEGNYKYIKSFDLVDNIMILEKNLLSKIKLIFKLRNYKFKTIIVHDGKNRSKFISFFLNYKKRIICINNLIDSQIEIIQKVCNKLKIAYDNKCLDFLDDRNYSIFDKPFDSYIHLHFDEKWKHSEYIKKYTNIEPNEEQLILFIKEIISKNKKLVITSGKKPPNILSNIINKIDSSRVKIFLDKDLMDIENIVINSSLLISCHGWISHIASARKINQIDIIDSSYPYNKWTSHFRNYTSFNRRSFNELSKIILSRI